VSSGRGLPNVGKILGHAQPAIAARYAHLGGDPVKAAAAIVASRIEQALFGGEGGEVVKLRR
jgi:hypothetical protein